MHQVPVEPSMLGARLVFLLVIGLLVGVPVLTGLAFGKKPALVVALGSFFLGGILLTLAAWVDVGVRSETSREFAPPLDSQPSSASPDGVERPAAEPQDPALQALAALLAEQMVFSDRAGPTWIDQNPGLEHDVYRWPVKSGLYSTQEECRGALAAAVAQAAAQYGKTLLADPGAIDVLLAQPNWLVAMQRNHPQFGKGGYKVEGVTYHYMESPEKPAVRVEIAADSGTPAAAQPAPFPHVDASGRTNLIEQPLYAETVQTSVGQMQQLHALLEFGDNARAQLRESWRQAAIPRRLRWAGGGFAAVLAIVGVLLAALRFDLASGGSHRGRLRWATAVAILLVVGGACGLCLL